MSMMELLKFQFNGIHEEVSAFANNLYSLVRKVIPLRKLYGDCVPYSSGECVVALDAHAKVFVYIFLPVCNAPVRC